MQMHNYANNIHEVTKLGFKNGNFTYVLCGNINLSFFIHSGINTSKMTAELYSLLKQSSIFNHHITIQHTYDLLLSRTTPDKKKYF